MAAGLGFKTFTTGEVLTAADVNGYLMQGILVFATEAARNSAITSPQEGQFAFTKDNNSLWYYTGSAWVASGATGDIEGVTAGVGISGGGTSGTVTITNDMATTITASGDIVVGTGSGTYDNLPIGTTGQVLTADTTVSPYKVKWAAPAAGGGMTLINTGGTALSGSQTITVSVSSDYVDLHIYITDWYRNDGQLYIYFNADTTATNYNSTIVRSFDNANGAIITTNNPSLSAAGTKNSADAQNFHSVRIPFYNDATVFKQANVFGRMITPADNLFTTFGNVIWRSTAAITSVSISNDTGNFAGGTMYVYGVK